MAMSAISSAAWGFVDGAMVRWVEFDLEGKVWTVPPARTKSAREHRIPLSDRALAILEEMKAGRTSDYLFPRPASYASAKSGHGVRNLAYTAHGFRSSFRDWASNETHYPRELAEHALLISSATRPNKPTVDRTRSRGGAN